MKFEPILNDLPISFAYERPQYFRNKAREDRWGTPVYFFPSTNKFDELGCGGYYYQYGYNANAKKGYLSNCTYVQGCFYHMRSGIILKELLGSAFTVFGRYKGRKTGGNFEGQYLGDVIQQGDMLIFADIDKNGKPNINGDGHIVSVEDTTNDVPIMEGAYSMKPCYEGKACITYTIKKSDLYTGKKIVLRSNTPYPFSSILYGVIHTGDVFDKEEKETYEELYYDTLAKLTVVEDKLNKIEDILKDKEK